MSTLDYERPGCSQFGAQMGRKSDLPENTQDKLHLRRIPARYGGDYDPGGAYWGDVGGQYGSQPLWCAWSEQGEDVLVRYIRAPSRTLAKAHFPNAKWFR